MPTLLVMGSFAAVPVLVRVDAATSAVPSPATPGTPYGSLPVTGAALLLVVAAVVALAVGLLLRKVAH